MFTVLEKYHQILQKKNMEAGPDKSHFFLQTQPQILINHFTQCAMLQILASVQNYYNPTMEQLNRILYQQSLAFLHKLNYDSLHL